MAPDAPGPVAAADLSEVLMAILDRLDAIDAVLADQSDRPDPSAALAEQLQGSLAALNARLGRLEEAVVQGVAGADASAASVIEAVTAVVAQGAVAADASAASVVEAVTAAVASSSPGEADHSGPEVAELVAELVAEQGERTRRLFERLEEARLSDSARLQGRLVALIEGIGPGSQPGAGAAAEMSELVGAVDRLDQARREDAATLQADLAGALERLDQARREDATMVRSDLAAAVERLDEARREDSATVRSDLAAAVAQLGDRGGDGGDKVAAGLADLAERIDGLRATIDRLVVETEQSLGRRATQVTRRLASDLGLRGRADR